MVARGERTAASRPAAKKARKTSAKVRQKKAARTVRKQATRKTAHKTSHKTSRKTGHKTRKGSSKGSARGPAAADRRRDATPVSKPPKLDMNAEVMEFIAAIDAYRQEYHRPFPGWSEILFVLKNLGYTKTDD